MNKPKTYNEWHSSLQGFEGLRHANCCRISYEAGQQSRQDEIDQLTTMNQRYIGKMQEQQDKIAELKSQLNNMEACYIEKKKQVEGQQKRIDVTSG